MTYIKSIQTEADCDVITLENGEIITISDGHISIYEDQAARNKGESQGYMRNRRHVQPLPIERGELKYLIRERGLTITQLIDAVAETNGIIGVGMISLGDQLQTYCHSHDRACQKS